MASSPTKRQTKTIDGVKLQLAHPDEFRSHWVGQEELIKQVRAAWLTVDEADLPLHPRLVGKPGVGKTSLAYAAARVLGQEVYLFQATMDTRPEDLIVTPVIAQRSLTTSRYAAIAMKAPTIIKLPVARDAIILISLSISACPGRSKMFA